MDCSPKNFGFWNLRGLNDPLKQREAKNWVFKNKLSLVGLIEHKVREPKVPTMIKSMFPLWNFVSNHPSSTMGRLLICWNPLVFHVQVLCQSSQYVHCKVLTCDGQHSFDATFIYGATSYLERQQLWADLQHLCVITPWVVLGDFNAIKSPTEKVGGDRAWTSWMEEFNSCLQSTELVDLRFSGCYYTWSNKQLGDAHISTKIDRVLVNERWIKDFCWSNAHFLNPGVSDHSPAVVYLTASTPPRKRPFRFFNFLAEHPKFIETVQQVWRKVIFGNPMYCVCEKLKHLQGDLKKLNTDEYSDLSARVASLRLQLAAIQSELGSHPNDPSKQAIERELCKQFLVFARAEESLAKQKSRVQWLKLGDQCTSFFFKSINNSRNRNRISSLVLEDGSVTHDIELVKHTFISYYTNLLGTKHLTDYSGSSRVDQLVTRRLSHSQSLDMVIEVTDKEIKDTFSSLNPQKAPGPDGYNAAFFQKAWPVIGHEVTSAVKLFFRSGQLLKKANATSVALVPKIPNPSKVGDYRPISCCNVVYKCIAKILANKIKPVLPILIDPAQSGFVQGRRIADNIFLTQELMRGYHKHSSSPRCAMKVDIMKAYDNVR
ncbi:hypothetical protein RHGRI_014320 [Rhododendron griersonianum]|uniref:Reverse transcriptase domain-containing protein n=1 Tax=Rhododendron griersonianum TaxID=479676 RepID=A0AAV6K982_9ERIC|nr:hypothetical protein RHGRI_014320 [Rhododendron griersonianum]